MTALRTHLGDRATAALLVDALGATTAVRATAAVDPAALDRMEAEADGHAASPRASEPVRLHTDGPASRAAEALGARAFTVGHDVFFGENQYRPGDPSSERLLDHERTHVAQQEALDRPLVQRQAVPGAGDAVSEPRFQSVDPSTLGHEELLAEINSLRTWLHHHDASDPYFEPSVEELETLQEERLARVRAGATWLARDQAPASLYALVPGSEDLLAVGPGHLGGPAESSAVSTTPQQFEHGLDEHHVPHYEVNDAAAVAALASRSQIPGFEAALPGTFSSAVSSEHVLTRGWTGALAELHVQIGNTRGILVTDLNTVPWGAEQRVGNFPVYDVQRTLTNELVQVKASTQAQQSGRFGLYRTGFEDIAGVRRPELFASTAETLFPDLPEATAQRSALRQGRLAVNVEDVPAFREHMTTRIANDPGPYRAILDLTLSETPIDGFRSLAQIESAADLSTAERTRIVETAARRITGERVAGHLTGAEIENLRRFRRGFGLGAEAPSPDAIESLAWPEALMAERAGGGTRGTLTAMRRSSVRGGGLGGLVAVAVEGGVLLVDPAENPTWMLDLATVGGLGVTSGAVGSAVDTGMAVRLARGGATSAAGGRAWLAGSRSISGGAGGGAGAVVFELGRMAVSDQPHTATDYAAKGTRAAVSGYISGALASALVGAIYGSSVPLVGTAVGFVVGFVGYLVVDSVIGDAVEGLVRDISRELSEMWSAVTWAASESPGSFLAPGFVTPLALRGGYRGLLENPYSAAMKRRAADARRR